MRRFARPVLCVLCLLLAAGAVSANPFTGSVGAAEAPSVRVEQSDPSLVARQGRLREAIGSMLYEWQSGRQPAVLWALLAAAFMYGVVHALGPGHRKTVVFSMYLAKNAPWWEPLASGTALAALHGGSALLVLFVLRGVAGAVSGRAASMARYLEGFSYVLLVVFALVLAAGSVRSLVKGHEHHSHRHGFAALLITGFYPCPGAILVLILAVQLQAVTVGALAVAAMSLGMSLPIIVSAYLAWFGRTGIFFALKERQALLGRTAAVIELTGYVMLFGFSVYIALPFFRGIIGL